MYARNSATPRPITVGSVVLIADGTVQTTGVSAKIRKDGGAWTAGSGSTSVEEGVWSYTPTQGETDCEALEVLIYKASCYQAWQEVVTTAVSTFGKVQAATVDDKTDYALSESSRDAIIADFLAHVITKGSAGTIERAFWQAAKAQASASGEVSGTPTASAFDTDLTAATGAFDDLLIVFTSGSLTGEARPIDTYISTSGRITLQEPLTAAPEAADEFLIVPSHVHKIADIQNGLATSAALAVVDGIVDQLKSRSGYTMSILAGAIANAQNAAEAYTITLDGTVYSVTYSGLDSSGNRTGATLTEA